VEGRLHPATCGEVGLVLRWWGDFMADADEQAGRPRGSSAHVVPDEAAMLRRIDGHAVWFWEVDGQPVHLTCVNPPTFGVARIGPVFTPVEHRGRGYASAAVAELSQRLLADGTRVFLYTDQANPTSNAVYRSLGYEPVVDMVDLLLV
jgi:predicted GNAT family acetyltransferase